MTSSEDEFLDDGIHVTQVPGGRSNEQRAKEDVRSSDSANVIEQGTGKVLSVVSNESGMASIPSSDGPNTVSTVETARKAQKGPPVSTRKAISLGAIDPLQDARSIRKANKMKADLYDRKERNRARVECEQALVRDVQALDVDWVGFFERAESAIAQAGCHRDHTQCRGVLADMGLDEEAIKMCLVCLELQGGYCDCEVILNVIAITEPRLDRNCADCGNDYDEYYFVRDEIWKSCGAGRALLCIGCLEMRLGHELCRRDFKPASPRRGSLRLLNRLARRRRAG
jgi:hypothetical protein